MKIKVLVLIAVFMATLAGCKKDTTYSFTDNFGGDGFTEYSILLSEHDGSGSKVHTEMLDWPEKGKKYVYTASEHSEKVKVKIQAKIGSTDYIKWIQQVFYLEEGKNIDITLEGTTVVGGKEP